MKELIGKYGLEELKQSAVDEETRNKLIQVNGELSAEARQQAAESFGSTVSGARDWWRENIYMGGIYEGLGGVFSSIAEGFKEGIKKIIMSIYQQYKEFKGVSSQQKTREVLKDKVDTGTLEKVFNVLRTGEFAVGGLLAGKSPITGIKERISVSDSLGITNSFGRLVADVFLDPTTYITLGTGGGVKIATKAGKEIALTKFGTKEFQQMSKRIGFNEAKKEFAEVVARNPSYIDKSGIKFMGQTIVPKTAFDNFAKFF